MKQVRLWNHEKDADKKAALAQRLPHGLLGQTWNPETYPNRWVHIEGQLFDYQIEDELLGHNFAYTRFNVQA